jgi:RimJ/RimL family protein N-acetyltransferase
MVGTSALEIDIFNKVGLLGILISPSARNTGIGGKAWSFIVHKIAKDLGLRKIKAGVAESNIAMKKIIVNSGMNLEGILKNDLVIDNKVCDLEQYCIIFA